MKYKVTSRSGEIVSLQEAKNHLRVTHNLEDTLIQTYLTAAIRTAEQYTGRAFSDVTVEATTETEDTVYTLNRYEPITAISSVVDKDGNALGYTYTESFNKIELDEQLVSEQHPITITYTSAAYAVDEEMVKMAIYLIVRDFYDYRIDRYQPSYHNTPYRKTSESILQAFKTTQFSP